MRAVFLIVGVLVAVPLAGCIKSSSDAVSTAGETDTSAAALPPVLPQVLTWKGYMVAGAASEAPAHFRATETAVAPLWKSGFNLHVHELPDVVEIMVDWTSASPSQLMFMAHVSADERNPRDWVEYEFPKDAMSQPMWPTDGPLCMRIPTNNVAPGHWHIMSHSRYGRDIQLTFTITTVGGHVEIPTGLHGHDLDAEEAYQIVELGSAPQREWQPCELSGEGAGS